jgi:hypothetical protein
MPFVQIPESLVAARETCMKTLAACQGGGQSLYAVIDLAASTDAKHWLSRLAQTADARSLFEQQPEAAATQHAPWLLRLAPDDRRIGLSHTVDEALVAWNVSWVESALAPDALATSLSRRLTARLPEGEALFRYYDPRLFPGWWGVLSDEERACFGAFGTRWWTLTAEGSLQADTLVGEVADDPFHPPWRINTAQQQALTRASEHQQLVSLLGKRRPEAFLNMRRGEQWHFVRTHDAGAEAHHVTHLADRLRYCELALEHGDDFAEQSRWQPVWAAMARQNQRLAAVLERLPPEAAASPSIPGITI